MKGTAILKGGRGGLDMSLHARWCEESLGSVVESPCSKSRIGRSACGQDDPH